MPTIPGAGHGSPYTASGAPTNGVTEVQTITPSAAPVAGSWRLRYLGFITAELAFNAPAAAVETALEALPVIGVGGCVVTLNGGVYTVTAAGNHVRRALPLLEVLESSLIDVGGDPVQMVVARATPGVDATARGALPGARLIDTANAQLYVNNGTALAPDWGLVPDGLAATNEELSSLVRFSGRLASAVLRVAANVADQETVSIGSDVYEFDRADDGVTQGRIAVTGHTDDTPAQATDALISAINTLGTQPVHAVDISNNIILLVADAPGPFSAALDHTMQGANNGWSAATMTGGEAAGVKRVVRMELVPTAVEVALDRISIPLDFAPAAAIVQPRVTATGAPFAWSGTVALQGGGAHRVDLINAGDASDFATTHTLTVVIYE